MKVKLNPSEVWAEYQEALNYNAQDSIRLTETVRRNENFMIDRQWEGLDVPDLSTPVMNILRQVVATFISNIVSDDIAVSITEFAAAEGAKQVLDMLSDEFVKVMELSSFKHKSRDVVRNAAVDGDGCVHYYFDVGDIGEEDDPEASATPGTIQAEILDNTAVYFGNPQEWDVEKQPYIIIQFRRFVEDVKEVAVDKEGITADEDESGVNKDTETEKVTVLRKYYKKGGQVHYVETTASARVTAPTAIGYTRYPVAWFPWVKVKNQYHGAAAITGMIPNQIFINKMFAMVMEHLKRMAFPKIVYDNTKLPEGFSNKVGAAIGVPGDPNLAVASGIQMPDMSNQVIVAIDKVIQYTRETMGASDAFLGNVKPDNTSAIIATQKATSMPLELQKMEFYRFVEDSVRIWLEMMAENYGVRPVEMNVPAGGDVMGLPGVLAEVVDEDALAGTEMVPTDEMGLTGEMPMAAEMGMMAYGEMPEEENATRTVLFDFSALKGMNLRLNVDIGAATYWSELMQVQTLDNLFQQGILDPELYLKLIPSGYIPNKHLILQSLQERKAEQEAMMRQQADMEAQEAAPDEMLAQLEGMA